MKRAFAVALAAACSLAVCLRAEAAVVDFDSFADAQYPGAYAGFTWGSNIATDSEGHYAGRHAGAITFPSSAIALYNTHGDTLAAVTAASSFDFNGAYFSGWYNDLAPATTITLNGYDNADLVGSVTYAIGNEFSWCAANFPHVNKVEFVSSNSGNWWLMDNFSYNESLPAVPEPASVALVGLGVAASALVRRRKS